MKFIVDAQLPLKLAVAFADSEGRVVISKDADFVTSHIVNESPRHLLQISTGNLPNSVLLPLVVDNLARIEAAFESVAYVELTANSLIAHA